jgi:Ca-activated chloride channel family protein
MKAYFSAIVPVGIVVFGVYLTETSNRSRPAVAEPQFGSLQGIVIDDSSEAVPGAWIGIHGTLHTAITDSSGAFRIDKILVGNYDIAAEAAGYSPATQYGVLISEELPAIITMRMAKIAPAVVADSTSIGLFKQKSTTTTTTYTISMTDANGCLVMNSQHQGAGGTAPYAYMWSTTTDQSGDPVFNTEEYGSIRENEFKKSISNPLSTFSIDVDHASYSNVRRFINQGEVPLADAVRIEEMINYFKYDYPNPLGSTPFSVYTEMSECPWNSEARLVHIGIQGKKLDHGQLDPSNLVFLVDVSGSMDEPNKLPLVKTALYKLVDHLNPGDRVAIVVYAGAAGLVLPSTRGTSKDVIKAALAELQAGGSTAGGEGIKLAYKIAQENFMANGNNRVILLTDGDFNVGVSSDGELVRLIEKKRESGVFLTVCGFGMGNYKDSKMEQLADKGNGNYYYIDSDLEAEKVFVSEMGGTLHTIAKDVKIQVEFNPAQVESYRLVGYENRLMNNEDFEDDTKDAGELGAGHTVTALYEIIPTQKFGAHSQSDNNHTAASNAADLRYQQTRVKPEAYDIDEVMVVKLRYKDPTGTVSKLIERPLKNDFRLLPQSSANLRWAAAVAEFGMLLRDSKFKGDADFNEVLSLANGAKGLDKEGYRGEFIHLVIQSIRLMASR